MTDRIAVLRDEASEERLRLSEAYDVLETEMKKVADWRARVRENPTTAAAVALGAGMLVGMLSQSGRTTHRGDVSGRARSAAGGSTFLSEVARGVWHEGRNIALLLLTRSLTSLLPEKSRK